MKHILFVYNPVAGTGRIKKNLFEIVDFYNENDYLITLCSIRKLEYLCDDLELENERYSMIVCSGGDGTLNMVLSFLKRKNVRANIAYIPSGSTNDYAYSLGISDEFSQALEKSLYGKAKKIDIGKFNDRYFLYVAAFGVFTKVAYSTSQRVKNLLGHAAYILEGIKQLSDLKSYHLAIQMDDFTVDDVFILGLITNSLSVGGFKNIIPHDVALDDGQFEVIFIKMPTNLSELHGIITSLLREKIDDNKCIIYCKTRKINILSNVALDWTLDGEYGGKHNVIEIINQQKELSIIV